MEPENCASEFTVSVSVFNGKLLPLKQNVFVEIGVSYLCCLELSDTEMSDCPVHCQYSERHLLDGKLAHLF